MKPSRRRRRAVQAARLQCRPSMPWRRVGGPAGALNAAANKFAMAASIGRLGGGIDPLLVADDGPPVVSIDRGIDSCSDWFADSYVNRVEGQLPQSRRERRRYGGKCGVRKGGGWDSQIRVF